MQGPLINSPAIDTSSSGAAPGIESVGTSITVDVLGKALQTFTTDRPAAREARREREQFREAVVEIVEQRLPGKWFPQTTEAQGRGLELARGIYTGANSINDYVDFIRNTYKNFRPGEAPTPPFVFTRRSPTFPSLFHSARVPSLGQIVRSRGTDPSLSERLERRRRDAGRFS